MTPPLKIGSWSVIIDTYSVAKGDTVNRLIRNAL